MTPEIKLLKTIVDTIERIYGNSGYMQTIVYAAKDGKDNWYSQAKKLIEQYENKL